MLSKECDLKFQHRLGQKTQPETDMAQIYPAEEGISNVEDAPGLTWPLGRFVTQSRGHETEMGRPSQM